jgi:hypothetical protein
LDTTVSFTSRKPGVSVFIADNANTVILLPRWHFAALGNC